MMLISRRYRYAVLLAAFSTAVVWGLRANAQDTDAVQKVVELNKRALAAYSNLDVEDAAKLLKQALDICATEKLEDHPMAARTHVHLGVVYVVGLKQREQGMEEFKKALRIDPRIRVTKAMINPEVQAAFAEASMDVSQGAEGEANAPAAAQPQPSAAQPAESAPPAEPAPPAQPAPAAESPIVHTPVTVSAPSHPIAIEAQVPASLGAERVALAYRPEGTSDFVTREMDPTENSDLYKSQIPPEATSGASVAYYILAQSGDGQVLAQNGTAAEPHVVNLSGEGAGAEGEVGGEGGEEAERLTFWVALAAGSGFGYHSGTPEANRTNDSGVALKSSGVSLSRLLQIAPEIGYFLSDSLILSLQGRIQIVSGASDVDGSKVAGNTSACKGGTCHPASYALAALAKATWFVGEPRKVTPFLSFAAGAGQIRHVVDLPKQNMTGCPPSGCKDTVVGGPVLFGPGVGITIELSDSFLIVASANALVGVPKVMANLDVNLGLAYVR
jgi:tetratricopeptide (TPR) repeat protein